MQMESDTIASLMVMPRIFVPISKEKKTFEFVGMVTSFSLPFRKNELQAAICGLATQMLRESNT